METPSPTMSAARLLLLGDYHLAALLQTPEHSDLHAVFLPVNDGLRADASTRDAAERALIPVRVALRFAERNVERELRALSGACVSVDGKKGGAVQALLFPNGLNAETRPRTHKQLEAARRVLNRLRTSTPAEPLRATSEPRLLAATNALEAALDARKTANEVLGAAIAAEFSSRDDFVRAYDANAGAIRQRHPKDKETQDLYFDAITTRRSADDEEEDTTP